MIKIAHLSDIHAGYTATRHLNNQGINVREADGYVAFARIVTDCINHDVDLVVIAGDTFHTSTPSIRTIIFVQNQFRRLAAAGIPIYALAGNHDVDDIRANIAASRVLDDPLRDIHSHIEPYAVHEVFDGVHLHMVSHHMFMDQSQTLPNVKSVDGAINIFTTHGSVIDPILEMKLHTEQSPREIVIPDWLLAENNWDAIMLGHIHERGWVGSSDGRTDTASTGIFYNGSIIRRGFADKTCTLGRGWTLWTIQDDGTFTQDIKTIPQRPQYDFTPIDASALTASEVTDIVIENLKSTQPDDGPVFNAASAPIIRQRIENITPGKKSALDLKAISDNAAHALHWDMPASFTPTSNSDTARRASEERIGTGTADLLGVYDEWAEDNETLKNISDNMRENVSRKAREFVKMGQEEVLAEE